MSGSYGREGLDFYTCGEYLLCKKCDYTNKPCRDNKDEMINNYIERKSLDKQRENEEFKEWLAETLDID